jgi:hypothetical protein
MIKVNTILKGDWDNLGPSLKVTAKMLSEDVKAQTQKMAKDYFKMLKDHILNNDLGLSPTVRGNNPWFRKGEFIKKLRIEENIKPNKGEIYVGAFEEDQYEKLNMYLLAKYLEYGTSHFPGRPLFGITGAQFEELYNRYFDKGVFIRAEKYWSESR